MKTLIVDRYENGYAICEDKDKKMFAIAKDEMPQSAKPGDVLDITSEGEISINVTETQKRREMILEKQKKAYKKSV